MAISNKIKAEQAKILCFQSMIVLIATLLILIIVVLFFKNKIDHSFLVPWALWILVLTGSRAYLIRRFQKKEKTKSPSYWLNIYTFTVFLSGLSWGLLLLQVLNPVSANEVLLLSFILTGMIAGALLPLSCYLPAYFAFSIPMLTPFAINMFTLEGTEFTSTGLLIIIFLVSMLAFSILVNRNILDSIKLRLNNIKLLDDLKIQKDLADVANSDKSRFLVATSHDLRQPLYALDLYLGALGAELKSAKQLTLLDKAKLSTNTLSVLLNALMDISKLDSGGVQPSPSYFDLSDLVESIYLDYEQQAQDKGIEIKASLDKVCVNTDQVLLGRIIRNLISNAINHNQNCCLTIATILGNDQVRLDISDSGKGIARTELVNIFSEFYQLNNPERNRNKGLGLGLAIVKRLSDLLLIPIEVDSVEAKGTRFSLTVAVEKRKIPRLKNIEPFANEELAGLFIIVIEDEQAVRDATKILLRSWGCEVLVSSSKAELMATLIKDNYPLPDLVISDYRLRDKNNGLYAVRAVNDYFEAKIPVLIVTGDSSVEIVFEINAQNYNLLIKPVSSQILGSKIASILKAE